MDTDEPVLPEGLTPEERRELGLDEGGLSHEETSSEVIDHALDHVDIGHAHGEMTLEDFFGAWEIYADPTLAGTFAGMLLGALGVFIILRNMVFLSAAISQTASLGVVLTYFIPTATLAWFGVEIDLFGGEPLVGAFVVTAAVTLAITSGLQGQSARRDAMLGLAFLVGSAGTLALGTAIVADVQDVKTLLLGSAVAVVPDDAHAVEWMAFGLLVLHAWLHRGFREVSFDRVGAMVRGLPVRGLEILLWLSIALAIAVCTRVLGAIPTFAYAVAPAWAAVQVSANVSRAMVVAGCIGASAGFGGYLLAFLWEMPPNALQPLTAVGLGLLVVVTHRGISRLRPPRKRLPSHRG